MSSLLTVSCALILLFSPTGAFPPSGLDSGSRRARRDVTCTPDFGYLHGSTCCLNCPAGTHVKSHCTSEGQRGQCEECDYGTFTEHANGLNQCFKCTQCRSDQRMVKQCTNTEDTECQCKPGRFCALDQACEVCKKCSRCEEDEVIVRNCTSTTNTECTKIQPRSDSPQVKAAVIVPLVLIVVVLIVLAGCCWKKKCGTTGSRRSVPDGMKAGQRYADSCPAEDRRNGETRGQGCLTWQGVRVKSPAGVKDERKVLCESLSSSASNSQHSLTGPQASAPHTPLLHARPVAPAQQPDRREDELFPKLVPVNGEESLRKCFSFFEELEIRYYNRFFRNLDISDNVIRSKDHLDHEDRIYALLNVWLEKEGRGASLDDLLKALLDLNQRRTAELVMEKAVNSGHYLRESE